MPETPAQRISRPVQDRVEAQPSIIQKTELVSFALVALLAISLIAVLYLARTLLMPITTALVIGTMLSAGAEFLERHRIPHAIAAALMITAACGIVAMIITLISAPLIDWTARLPELSLQLKEKLHIFDRPIAFWHQIEQALGINPTDNSLVLPKIEWIQPTLEFLSPTLTEILLFLVTLILLVASWPSLRRSLIMTSGEHESRLRTLRILNAIEKRLGSYLLTVTVINLAVGISAGLICSVMGLPDPAGLGAVAAMLNYIPIIGPIIMFAILLMISVITSETLSTGLVAPLLFAIATFLEGHFITPTIIGRHLSLNALAIFFAFAFWTWLWGPIGAFLASPVLIVALILKENLIPAHPPQLSNQ